MAVVGCGPTRPAQFKDGAKLYDKQSHQYFGKVVGFNADHDFHNGMPPQPSILIEPADGNAATRSWGGVQHVYGDFRCETIEPARWWEASRFKQQNSRKT